MVRSLFEYVVYDLDRQQIIDFRLKPWADGYLVLRTALYHNTTGEETASHAVKQKDAPTVKWLKRHVPPRGLEPLSSP